MYRTLVIALILPLFPCHFVHSQNDSLHNEIYKGLIVDDSLGYPLPFVHYWNESTRMGGIANELGEFSIKAGNNDTIVFSSIGYSYKMVVIEGIAFNTKNEVRLIPKTYEIGEAVVIGYRSYDDFKEQFLNLDVRDEKIDRLRESLNNLGTIAALEADRERAVKDKMNGFGYSTMIGGRMTKDQAKRMEIERLKIRSKVIEEKFNRALVADITKLDGDELTRFIAICNFSEDFLYKTDLFTIIETVSNKYNLYAATFDSIPTTD